jgi:anti-sigma B factor antagonist
MVTAMTVHTDAWPMSTKTYLRVLSEHYGQRSVMRLAGELDICGRDRLRHAISCVLEHHPAILVVDLSELSFTDCAGLSVLIWAHKRLAERGDSLIVTGQQPTVQRLLHLTGLDSYLHFSAAGVVNDDPARSSYAEEIPDKDPGTADPPGETAGRRRWDDQAGANATVAGP